MYCKNKTLLHRLAHLLGIQSLNICYPLEDLINFEEVVSMSNALDRYQEAAARTANHDTDKIIKRLQDNPQLVELLNYAMGAAGEAGEIVDLIKKIVFHGHELDAAAVEKLLFEVGDDLFYLSNIARVLNTKLSQAAGMNINKLKKRYPDGFDEQKSINRDPSQS